MHGTWREPVPLSKKARPRAWTKKTETQGIVFRDVAELAYPIKTLAALGAALEKAGIDCCRSSLANYLNGSRDVPGPVLAIVFAEMMCQLARRS